MHFSIECTRDLVQCFPEVEENFPADAQEIILQHLLELYPDSSITDDEIAAFEAHESLEELADFHGVDYTKICREIYERFADADDFPEVDEDGNPTGELLDFGELTEEQQAQIEDDYADDIREQVEKQLKQDDILIFTLSDGFMTYDPTR